MHRDLCGMIKVVVNIPCDEQIFVTGVTVKKLL